MPEAYIVEAVRTPVGKRGGSLAEIHSADLGGHVARTAWLVAGLPDEVPGVTIDRQCGSSQQAVHFAAQGVMSGTQDLVIAGGVQNMSMIPIGTALTVAKDMGFEDPFSGSEGWRARYGDEEISQFRGAELIAEK